MTVADFLDFLAAAPSLNDAFVDDTEEILAASREMRPVDPWAA